MQTHSDQESPLEITLQISPSYLKRKRKLRIVPTERDKWILAANLEDNFHPNKRIVIQQNVDSGKSKLVNLHTQKTLCEHEFDYVEITRWLENKYENDDVCPECNKLGGHEKRRLIKSFLLPDVIDDDDLIQRKAELVRQYGNFFVVVAWEGDNQEDVDYELYTFKSIHGVLGFRRAINDFPDITDLKDANTMYKRGYDRGIMASRLWPKFGRVVLVAK